MASQADLEAVVAQEYTVQELVGRGVRQARTASRSVGVAVDQLTILQSYGSVWRALDSDGTSVALKKIEDAFANVVDAKVCFYVSGACFFFKMRF